MSEFLENEFRFISLSFWVRKDRNVELLDHQLFSTHKKDDVNFNQLKFKEGHPSMV